MPLGTFSNSSTKGADGCINCPPGDDNTMEIQGENCQDAEYHNTKCDQETQTELFKLPIDDLHEPMEEKQKESL
ncbi:hypothetical protein OS493_028442 [Desmophyllum pertusum]|uniref:Uncharacterized protein n=1 Tax=Desmophyllum pertusum TaxID=174260 RepID=A0A9W9ZNU1_9CNID|nr:hypothetical protein OS493_028442 [Desmophyllum pertusum]